MPGSARRNPFVGREQELARLQAAFDDAVSGQGALVVVVGEPGIGKTSLCAEFASRVTEQRGLTLTGHCYERDRSLPYLPFIEALRPYIAGREAASLAAELDAGAAEVARLLPEAHERLNLKPAPDEPHDPEEARYRLLEAVSVFLRNLAESSASGGLLLVLEDLHDADRGTLDLLTHVVRRLAGSRILIAGTYRDVEVDRAHPLSAALAELRRTATIERIHLRGLRVEEVQELLDGIAHESVPSGLARAVHGQTEGNPLFAQEVGRYLADEQLLQVQEGRTQQRSEQSVLTSVPEGLRDVIGRRLSRLSPECNRLLGIAAVVGREFGLSTLQAVSDAEEGALLEAMEQAVRAGVIEDCSTRQSVRFRFAHALFRQTLYEEILTPRRLRLHQRIARALEADYGANPTQHAAELGEHFAQSNDPADLAKAVAYGELAAGHAASVYAYGEAARHLTQALEVQEALDPADRAKCCDLLLALGDALLPAGEPLRVAETVAPEALALAEALDDRARASRACQAMLQGIWRQRGAPAQSGTRYREGAAKADLYAVSGSLDRVYADLALSNAVVIEDTEKSWDLIQRALALARDLDDREALYRCAEHIVRRSWTPEHQEGRLRAAEEFASHRPDGIGLAMLGSVIVFSFRPLLAYGRRREAEEALRRAKEIAERTQDNALLIRHLGQVLVLDGIDGRLDETVEAAKRLRVRAQEVGVPGIGLAQASLSTLWPLIHLGRADEWLTMETEETRAAVAEGRAVVVWASERALFLAHQGRWDELRPLFDHLRDHLKTSEQGSGLHLSSLTGYLAAAVLAQDRELAILLRERLAPCAGLINDFFATCIARHLGDASALLGEREEARRYYEQALAVCAKIGFRPEIALTHLGMAELLLGEAVSHQPSAISNEPSAISHQLSAPHPSPPDEEQDRLKADKLRADSYRADKLTAESVRAEALTHLDFAIVEFRDMKMQPALERALAAAERAKTGGSRPPATVATDPDRLTPREVEILGLLAAGKSNPEIAAALVLSVHTVERHVANIYTKIGARGRAEAIAYALRRHLM